MADDPLKESLKGKPTMLTEAEVARLRNDDENVFLDYEYDKVERILTMDEVEATMLRLRNAFDATPAQPNEGEEALRARIERQDPTFEAFAQSHPSIFRMCTCATTTPTQLETLRGMMRLRQRVERGQTNEADASVSLDRYLHRQSGKTRSEAKASAPNSE